MSSRKRYESDIYAIQTQSRENIPSSIDSSIIMSRAIDTNTNTNTDTNTKATCELCKDISESKFVILNCGHVFHVQCLVQYQLKDIYKYETLGESYFTNTKCKVCDVIVDKEDMLIIHTKYMSSTESLLLMFVNRLETLDYELKKVKDDLRSCLDEKHVLEQSREKSKHIISILETL